MKKHLLNRPKVSEASWYYSHMWGEIGYQELLPGKGIYKPDYNPDIHRIVEFSFHHKLKWRGKVGFALVYFEKGKIRKEVRDESRLLHTRKNTLFYMIRKKKSYLAYLFLKPDYINELIGLGLSPNEYSLESPYTRVFPEED